MQDKLGIQVERCVLVFIHSDICDNSSNAIEPLDLMLKLFLIIRRLLTLLVPVDYMDLECLR